MTRRESDLYSKVLEEPEVRTGILVPMNPFGKMTLGNWFPNIGDGTKGLHTSAEGTLAMWYQQKLREAPYSGDGPTPTRNSRNRMSSLAHTRRSYEHPRRDCIPLRMSK